MSRQQRKRERTEPSPWRSLAIPLPYLKRYKRLAGGSLVLMVLGALGALLAPWPLGFLVDSALGEKQAPGWISSLFGQGPTRMILVAVVASILIAVLTQGLGVLESYFNTKLEQRVALDFRSDLFEHCANLSQGYHDFRSTGMFMYQINNEAHYAGSVTVAIPPLIQGVLTLGGMFFVTYRLSPPLALLALSVVPVIYYSTIYYSRVIEPRVQLVRGLEGRSLQIVNEVFQLLRVVVSFNRQRYEWQRFRHQGEDAVEARVRVTVAQTLFGLVVAVTTAIGTGLIIGVGAHSVLNRRLTVGELLIVLAYIGEIYTPLSTISSTFGNLQNDLIGLRAARKLLDTEPDVKDAPDAVELSSVRGDITFENVCFNYPGRRSTIEDVSFHVKAGDIVAVVGPTGAGKTTLVSLISRFYDPKGGRILVDQHDIRQVTQRSLRRHISVVPQEPLLFELSVADNIRYGRLDASHDEIVQAAKAANVHDFVTRLPQGYDTLVGERGARFSGGERQRLCIARAFLKDAPILVLDEPTSAIDSRTESIILEALERLMQGRTTFMVAHRLSTVRKANLIVVLNEGRLVEKGSHEELLEHAGLYRLLWEVQTGRPVELAGGRPGETSAQLPPNAAVTAGNGHLLEPSRRARRRARPGRIGLLNDIANFLRRQFPSYTVRYTATEPSRNELADAIATKTTVTLSDRWRSGQAATRGPAAADNAGPAPLEASDSDAKERDTVAPASSNFASRSPLSPAARTRPKIVVLGMMTKMPVAGVVWQTVQYLVGFKQLGFDVYYVEAHARTPSMLMEKETDNSSELAAGFIEKVMRRFGLEDKWAYHALHDDGRCHGMSRPQLDQLYRSAALIINLHGGTEPLDEHARWGTLIYVETDPVQLQVELHEGLQQTIDFLEPHQAFFTFGENIGNASCPLPVSDRFPFHRTRQPVVTAFWRASAQDRRPSVFTSIGNWRQEWRDVAFNGEVYHWSKHFEFLKFIELPQRTRQPFELALASYTDEDQRMLEKHGWAVRPALELSVDVDDYRRYVAGSRGEFTVAKDQNVRLQTGWFSDRSASYLAAGRPVVTQDTGFRGVLPVGEGLFAFSTMDEAVAAVEAVNGDYERHGKAAFEVAREFFEYDVVLGSLLGQVGLPRRVGRGSHEAANAFPGSLSLGSVAGRPTMLPDETIDTVLSRPFPDIGALAARPVLGPRPVASIVVITTNSLLHTRMCAESLLSRTNYPRYEILFVGGVSDDRTLEYLKHLDSEFDHVRLLLDFQHPVAAVNAGLADATGDVLVVLHSRTILTPGWLSGLAAHLTDSAVGLVGPVTNLRHVNATTEATYSTYGELLTFVAGRQKDHVGEVRDAVTLPMSCAALRREVYEHVGPLEQQHQPGSSVDAYSMHDYSKRVRDAGLRVVVAEDVFVHCFTEPLSSPERSATRRGHGPRIVEGAAGRRWAARPHEE